MGISNVINIFARGNEVAVKSALRNKGDSHKRNLYNNNSQRSTNIEKIYCSSVLRLISMFRKFI